jgi:hypothetical protein
MKDSKMLIADSAAAYKEQIAQAAMVIFETMNALGEIKIGTIEVVGEKSGLIMDLEGDGLIGTIFEPVQGAVPAEYWKLLRLLRAKPAKAVPMGRMVLVDPGILERIKAILEEYVGDFTDRIFENQMKNQGIKVEELRGEDVRRLILALAKATSMIVGRRKGRELSGRLTELVKGGE